MKSKLRPCRPPHLVLLTALACAALSPARAQSRATTAFEGARVSEVPYHVVHGLIVIPVAIEGTTLQLILDSGAPLIVFRDSTAATRFHLNVVGRARVGGVGDGQPRSVPLATGVTARIGAFTITNATAIIGAAANALDGVDGIIGGPVFTGAVVEFDYDRKVVRFHHPDAPIPEMIGDTVPLRVDPSLQSYLQARVTINGKSLPIDLHLDTGARQALAVVRDFAARHDANPSPSISTIVAFGSLGAARGSLFRAGELRIGRAALSGVAASLVDRQPGGEGNLGQGALERFHVWIDYPHGRVVLKPRANFADPFPANTTGIVISPAPRSRPRVIADVPAGTPAHDAGLMVGDTILAVNGRSIDTADDDFIRTQLINARPGAPLLLSIRRGDALVERRLTPRVLLP